MSVLQHLLDGYTGGQVHRHTNKTGFSLLLPSIGVGLGKRNSLRPFLPGGVASTRGTYRQWVLVSEVDQTRCRSVTVCGHSYPVVSRARAVPHRLVSEGRGLPPESAQHPASSNIEIIQTYNAGYKYCSNLIPGQLMIISVRTQGFAASNCLITLKRWSGGVMMGYILHFTQAVTPL